MIGRVRRWARVSRAGLMTPRLSLPIVRIGAEVAGDLLPRGIEGLPDRFQRVRSKWCAVYQLASDITFVNDNVTYEIGYAPGTRKRLRLIRNETVPITDLKGIGLLDTLLHDPFRTLNDLVTVLTNCEAPVNSWHLPDRDRKQPVYVLAPPTPTPFSTALLSAAKKQGRQKFRSFNMREIARLTAKTLGNKALPRSELWPPGRTPRISRLGATINALHSLLRLRGLDIPVLLVAHTRSRLPADLADQAARIGSDVELPALLRTFRDDVQDATNGYAETPDLPLTLLDRIHCGQAAAEDEQDDLADYFLETEEFRRALDGNANLIIGRKGNGKTVICLQVRDRTRSKKNNVVVDLNPEGYQLIKLKELISHEPKAIEKNL